MPVEEWAKNCGAAIKTFAARAPEAFPGKFAAALDLGVRLR
jgi:hypothetical protein